ncbi:MAG: zinc ABC transporter substrate-binding protein [Pseudophaeobacter sp. bin_em_oilr2.035]|uniref:zinc ABC transporter substrate-binding protein n=1 Tax=Phaeobacter sp. SYSU ZJ3003 TaxID=2109330 RepID=UPI00351CADF2|nr:zinc ABC transporter substrate-binding protein [Pseudophaeobacter sp. bin_em_oilr2.035]
MKGLSYAAALPAVIGAGMALAEVPRVAVDIAPVHGLVARVMQGVGEPDLVVPPGASPHGYAMRPSEALALDRADAVFWIGEALTPWLEGPLETLAGRARVTELLEVDGTLELEFRSGTTFDHDDHDHEAEHDHDGHAGEDHDGHEDHAEEGEHGDDHDHMAHDEHGDAHHEDHAGHAHEGIDPHAWLAPENAELWLSVIAAELAALDPENAEIYMANAKAGQAEIKETVGRLDAVLEPLRASSFIVFHDAYQYFEHSFALTSSGAISLGDASDPSPARIAEIRDAVASHGVACVFSEPQFNPGLVDTVLDGTGAKTVVIDPMGSHIPPGPEFYTDLLSELGSAMASCH